MDGMMRVAVTICLLAGAFAKLRYDGHKLVSIYTTSQQDVEFVNSLETQHGFQGLDFWTQPSRVHTTDIRVSPSDFEELRTLLTHEGIEFKVVKENVQIDIDKEESAGRSTTRDSGPCDVINEYCTFEEIEALLAAWQTANPDKMSYVSMGLTYEGENIYMVRIFENMSSDFKPAVIVEAGTHGREWITVSSALVLIQELLSDTPRAQAMLAKYDWYIVPVHNPDGYKYTHVTDRLWRKNRVPCPEMEPFIGIDLNRNWNVSHGGVGTSPNCSSNVYPGESAFDATETQALDKEFKYIQSFTTVKAFFSIHSYSQMMLVPFAFTSIKPSNYDFLYYVADEMMQALFEVDRRRFEVGTPPDILYAASGGAYDYFFLQGVPYSYTYELRPASLSQGGFILPPEQIYHGTEEFVASIQRFVELDL